MLIGFRCLLGCGTGVLSPWFFTGFRIWSLLRNGECSWRDHPMFTELHSGCKLYVCEAVARGACLEMVACTQFALQTWRIHSAQVFLRGGRALGRRLLFAWRGWPLAAVLGDGRRVIQGLGACALP